jgi:hypothetical protein
VATTITTTNHGDGLQGSPDKRLDLAPDGTLWALIVAQGNPGTAKFFRSSNGGATWTYASGSDISLGQSSAVPSFFIDADGYAHVSWIKWNANPQVVIYARGKPTGTATTDRGWSWTNLTISPASGRTGVDSDLVAFRSGTGWVAFVAYGLGSGNGCQVARVTITASGALAVGATTMGPSTGLAAWQFGSIEFNHTGDGKTAAALPHIYLCSAVQGTSAPVRVQRALYSGGSWTWEAPVTAATGDVVNTTMCTVWDGGLLMTAVALTSATILVSEWDGAAGSVTARNPPAAPGGTGNVLGLSLAVDPATDDVYLAYYDATDGDIRWSKFTRGANTWSAWAVAVAQGVPGGDGKVSLVRHPSRDSVDMIFAQGSGGSWTVLSQQLVALVRTSGAPTLVSPANGAALDLAAGATFTWTYNPVSPGDTQQAWAFKRVEGATTEYWNATSQSWSGTIIWNTTVAATPTSAVFTAGKWTNATTYTWTVATRSSTGSDSAFAAVRTVIATTAPVVVVTAPSGMTFADSSPNVVWTYTCLDAQRDYRVRIIEEQAGIDPDVTTPVWDSGVVSSAIGRFVRVGVSLTNGAAYRAYVKSTSSAAVASAWAYSQFVISIVAPNGPLVEVIDEIHYGTDVPRARLDLLARSSLLTAAQDVGSGGWEDDTNSTILQQLADTTNQLLPGIKVTSVASGLMGVRTVPGSPPLAPYGQAQPPGPLSFPAVAGIVYTLVGSVKAAATSRTARARLRWYDADDGTGALISESVGDAVIVTSGAYTQTVLTATAPVGAVLARVVFEILGPTAAGEIFYIAEMSFAPGRSTNYQPGGYSATQTIRVERSDDDGVTWKEILSRVKPSLAQQAIATDRTMPFGVDVKYRAYTDVDPGLGAVFTSAVSLISTINLDADRWAIRDPTDDDGEIYAYVVGHRRSDDESSSVHRPAGREFPIVDTEGQQAAVGMLSVFVPVADIDSAVLVLRRTVPMIVQGPTGMIFLARLLRRDYKVEALRHRVIDIDYVDIQEAL